MLHSQKLNNKIHILHERYLRVTHEDLKTSFEEVLETVNSVSVPYKNLQCLAFELYKVFKGMPRDIIKMYLN